MPSRSKKNKVKATLLAGAAALGTMMSTAFGDVGGGDRIVGAPFATRAGRAHFDGLVKVGLGVDGSTPTGTWRVTTKLKNPTYYHPRGGDIIAADDPNNPLGERWIGLEGTSGQAVGQERYGIHGTIEPESIGQSVSLGCIRLHNQDVEALYTFLIERHSTVTVHE